jgi:hypothetical protein
LAPFSPVSEGKELLQRRITGISVGGLLAESSGYSSYPFFFSQFGVAFGVEYLMPVAAGGLIVHLLMGKETA